MHYYIDGYNLLFRILRPEENLQIQREELIKDVAVKVNALELDVTIVFDSHYRDQVGSKNHFKRLEVVFTNYGESADEYIMQAIKEALLPSHQVVVTSDKKLAWYCRRRLAKTEYVEEFISWLNRRYKNRLRKNKPMEVPLKTPPKSSKESPSKLPKKDSTLEECFGYYLETFETLSSSYADALQPKSVESSKAKRKKKVIQQPKEDILISDMERWLKAFDQNINSQDV